jgi:hypothetical protein
MLPFQSHKIEVLRDLQGEIAARRRHSLQHFAIRHLDSGLSEEWNPAIWNIALNVREEGLRRQRLLGFSAISNEPILLIGILLISSRAQVWDPKLGNGSS